MIITWIALGAGVIGAVSGLGSFVWSVRAWKREGPVLRVSARHEHQDDRLVVSGVIRNVGRFETTVTDAYLIWSRGRRDCVPDEGLSSAARFVSIPDEHISGLRLPQLIKPQTMVRFVVSGIDAIDTLKNAKPLTPVLTKRAYEAVREGVLHIIFETAAGEMIVASMRPWRHLALAGSFVRHHEPGEVLAEPAADPDLP